MEREKESELLLLTHERALNTQPQPGCRHKNVPCIVIQYTIVDIKMLVNMHDAAHFTHACVAPLQPE